MRKFGKGLTLASLFMVMSAVAVLAAPLYLITLTVTENAGNSYTSLPIIVGVNNQNLVDQGYLGNGLDAKVDDGTNYLPRMIADNKTLFVSDITANTAKTFNYTLHDANFTASMQIVVGHNGYFTIPDTAAIEPGNNWEMSLGPINTTSGNKNIFDKGSIGANVTASGTVLSYVNNGTSTITTQLSGVANGSYIDVKITAGNITLTAGLSSNSTAFSGNVTDTAANWTVGGNDVFSYLDYLTMSRPSVPGGLHYAYITSGNFWNGGFGGDGYISVIDISNSTNLTKTGQVQMPGGIDDIMNIARSGNFVYTVSPGWGKLISVNVTDPTNPTIVQNLSLPAGAYPLAIAIKGDYAFVSDQTARRIYSVNISDPANMIISGNATKNTGDWTTDFYRPNGLTISGNWLFVGNEQNLSSVNITDPTNMAYGSQVVPGGPFGFEGLGNMATDGNFIYFSGASFGTHFWSVNVTDPLAMTIAANLTVSNSTNGFYKLGNYVYGAGNGDGVLHIWDVSNPAIPVETGNLTLVGFVSTPENLYVQGNSAFIVGANGLAVASVTSKIAPTFITEIHGVSGAPDGNFMWLAYGLATMPSPDIPASTIIDYYPQAIIVGNTLPDLQNTANATITWGSNPAGVSTLASPDILSENLATLQNPTTPGGVSLLNTLPAQPAGLYTEHLPPMPDNTPSALFWYPFFFFAICIIGLLIYEATARTGGEGSLATMCVVMWGCLAALGVIGVAKSPSVNLMPLFPAILFPIPALSLTMSRRHVGWG